jgi:hypothetical protein
VLKHQKRALVVVFQLVHRHDVGMIELCGGVGFLHEALAGGVANVRQQQLDGDDAIQPLVQRAIDR